MYQAENPGYLHAEKISFRFVSFLYRFVRNSSNLVNPRIILRSIGQHFFAKKKDKKQQGKISLAN